MRLKQEIGNEAVRDIILEARARVAELPPEDISDPWPSYRNFDVEAMPVKLEPTRQDK